MKVTFKRTGERRYSVTVEGLKINTATMDPAPGYHERLPHDAAHFIVENVFGIRGGLFGQLAAGGTANTFFSKDAKNLRKAKKRGAEILKANHADAALSEHAVYAAQSRWEGNEIVPETKISDKNLKLMIAGFQDFSEKWSKLPVGGMITLNWNHTPDLKKTR